MTREVLIVVHQGYSTAGRVGELLGTRGITFDRRCPCQGDALPVDLSTYAAAIVFGGPQSANDDHLPGIRAELDWIEHHALPSGLPILGICLGAQEIARVLGSRISRHPQGLVEIGYYEVAPTGEANDFLACPTMFYQWHAETFEIPRGAVHLATSAAFEGQAFRYGDRIYGIEFHPEITRAMIEHWCTSETGRPKLALPGAQPHPAHVDGHARYADASDDWLARFLDERLVAAACDAAESSG